jgi:hypothetical protein
MGKVHRQKEWNKEDYYWNHPYIALYSSRRFDSRAVLVNEIFNQKI